MTTIPFYEKKAPYFEFSNFYIKEFELDNEKWLSVEHYFQAQKFYIPDSKDHIEYMNIIKLANTPMKTKILGSQKKSGGYASKWVVNKDTFNKTLNETIDKYKHVKIRSDWDNIRIDVMRKALLAKFSQHESLKNLLLKTNNATIIEASPRDYFWGIGKDNSGQNWLGKLLMEIRAHL